MAYPRFQRARDFKFSKRTAGNVAVSSTTFTAVDTALDVVLPAQVGDVIEYGVNGLWLNDGSVQGALEVYTMVSGSPVNPFGQGPGWYGLPLSQYVIIGASAFRTMVSGDLSNGTVTLRLFARVISAGTRTLAAGSNDPLMIYAKNLGPQDPN